MFLQFDLHVLLISGMTKNGELMTIKQEMQAISFGFFRLQRDENVQVNGFVYLIDMTGFGTKHISRLSSPDMRKWYSFWQVSFILRLREVHKKLPLYYVAVP